MKEIVGSTYPCCFSVFLLFSSFHSMAKMSLKSRINECNCGSCLVFTLFQLIDLTAIYKVGKITCIDFYFGLKQTECLQYFRRSLKERQFSCRPRHLFSSLSFCRLRYNRRIVIIIVVFSALIFVSSSTSFRQSRCHFPHNHHGNYSPLIFWRSSAFANSLAATFSILSLYSKFW